MTIASLIKKYTILLFIFLALGEVLYYTNHEIFRFLDLSYPPKTSKLLQMVVKIVFSFVSNLIISIFAIGDLRKFKSRFYLIPVIILLNKVVGTCMLLVYLLYLAQQENEKEVNTVYPLP